VSRRKVAYHVNQVICAKPRVFPCAHCATLPAQKQKDRPALRHEPANRQMGQQPCHAPARRTGAPLWPARGRQRERAPDGPGSLLIQSAGFSRRAFADELAAAREQIPMSQPVVEELRRAARY
jgi:hypothetical protein